MLLKVLMNPSMITLNTKFKLPLKDDFYEVRLSELKRLVVLNLSLVCTDDILEVVGNNCRLLQVIHIVSKIGSVAHRTRRQLNALKLKFFVSDKGLEHLHKCKFLKTIVMNKVTRSNCGGGKITQDGIRKLLHVLPNVQFISYNDMGLVLEKGIDTNQRFNLLHLHDGHLDPLHIDLFFKHCPKLRGLCLMLPPSDSHTSIPETCLLKLAESKLTLSSLALGLFPVDRAFYKFLTVKGNHITNLSIFHYFTITAHTIFLIGQNCPYIEFLEVNLVLCYEEDDDDDENFNYSMLKNTQNYNFFTCLQSLKILGAKWEPEIIIPLCLTNAIYLKHLVLMNKEHYRYIDKIILNLLKKNPLSKLKSASLLDGFCVTINTLVKLILGMEDLETIVVTRGSGYKDHLEQLRTDNNLNLNITTECMIENDMKNYGNCFCHYWQNGYMQKF
ncbi:hypothetical protein O3M35_002691 [Rhynocoris fuscipes]|uniref:Uncharacterized protein n=1 Tax=Rhynocoris fuscipes TaxID=488301 RepID=A0AAW1CM96_9HEMI